jgi:hypothetical protein
MSLFEMGMLLCFGASWPFSVYKTWKAKTNKGKSLIFLWLVLIGYGCGIAHKILYSRDFVIAFYVVNATLVLVDIVLCTTYTRREKLQAALGNS